MQKNDFSDIDEQIRHTVENAKNYINFASVKDNINSVAENTINEVISQVNSQVNGVKTQFKDVSKSFEKNVINNVFLNRNKDKNEISKYISKKPAGRYSGIALIGIGTIGAITCSILISISHFVVTVLKKTLGMGFSALTGSLILILIINIVFILRGSSVRNRVKRFKKYSECIEKNKYCTIKELADAIQKKEKYVVKDLKKMISLDMFKQAHFDEDYKYFILSDEIYNEYLECLKSFKERKVNEDKKINKEDLTELDKVLEFGNGYIKEIQEVNFSITNNNMSEKLDKLQKIISEIFKCIQKNPQKLNEVKKLTNHYLPMTLKLVKSYKELNEQEIQGTNIKKAKIEIEKSIDLINFAFAKLLDDLFEDVVLDITTDISVLETLFTQEGLTKDDFKK